jgi:peptidoglycan/LPS O-acetylase OafA/YrhL
VKGFFVISGGLVTRSCLSSRSLREFVEKRMRRIVPAYLTTILFCFVIGLCVTWLPLGAFLSARETLKYLLSNSVFLNFVQPTLPGVFAEHPVPVMNGALWSIKVELCLYACVPAIVYLFNRVGGYATTGLSFAVALLWPLALGHLLPDSRFVGELGRQFPGRLHLFVLGALFATNKDVGPWLGRIAAGSLVWFWMTRDHSLRAVVEPVAYASTVWFAATRLPFKLDAGRWGDMSYGTYLLHFPIIQLFIHVGLFRGNVWVGMAVTLATVMTAAFVLWHVVEKRLLKRSSQLQRNLTP